MNVVLSLMRRDQWTTEKISFWTYYICFVVYSGSAQNLHPCPIIKSSILVLSRKVELIPRFRYVVGLTNH